MTSSKFGGTLFLAQAIPWALLFILWVAVALTLTMVVVIPLRLVAWVIRGGAKLVELLLGALLAVLFAARPVPSKGTPKPKDPTATAPITEGGIC